MMQSCKYFLEPVRISAPMYFWHLLDIVQSKAGEPLLSQLSKQDDKFAQLLNPDSEDASRVSLSFGAFQPKGLCAVTILDLNRWFASACVCVVSHFLRLLMFVHGLAASQII